MKKLVTVLTVLIIVGICIPTASADDMYGDVNNIIDDELLEIIDTSKSGDIPYQEASISGSSGELDSILIKDITKFQHVSYFDFVIDGNQGYEGDSYLSSGVHDTTYTFNGQTKPCRIYISRATNILGQITSTKFTIFFEDWDIGNLSGPQWVNTPYSFYKGTVNIKSSATYWEENPTDIALTSFGVYKGMWRGTYQAGHATGLIWKNLIRVNELSGYIDGYDILLNRTVNDIPYQSVLNIYNDELLIFTNSEFGTDINIWYPSDSINKINIISPAEVVYNYSLDSGDSIPTPTNATTTVYVRNSQTGALIANAHIDISASVNGSLYEVINETIPTGIYAGTLQPTGGGLPNPDFYRLITTAEGYISVVPHIDFEVDGVTTIYAYLEPVGGAPIDENNTFIDFYVRDLNANPISGATVNFGGHTLITNSAGYAVLEVGKNSTYSWTVSKSGYGPLTGNAVIGADPRHTINTVLAPAVTPTTSTPIPTSTSISPTPTMTAPTGEPVSNWLEWFAAHFGMILGGGVEIGKIFMWLCFTVPVGVYVGKESRAGAAGFMAGAGIVTLFFVLIGWVPIWLVVLLALIIGLLYAKVFSNSDNGGGR